MNFRTSILFRSSEHSGQGGGAREPSPGKPPGRVLLVEEDLKQLQRISRLLQDNRYSVVSAMDRDQALALAGQGKISLMVISPSMPGLALGDLLEVTGHKIPYLLMISSKRELESDGLSEIAIRKPVKIGELKRRIDEILGHKSRFPGKPAGGPPQMGGQGASGSGEGEAASGDDGGSRPAAMGPRSKDGRKPEAQGIEDILEEFGLLSGPGAGSIGSSGGDFGKGGRRKALREAQGESDPRPDSEEGLLAPSREGPGGGGEAQDGTLFEECRAFVRESIRKAERGNLPDIHGCEGLVHRVIGSLEDSRDLLLEATDRDQEFKLSRHCVNVSVLSLVLARTLGLSRERQAQLGMAALLHEVGVVKLPPGLTEKEGLMIREELSELRRRPVYSKELLSGLGERYSRLAETVGQVFERDDGTGFPRGLMGADILEEAKILGVADLMDACIHSRPNRRVMTGYETVLELTGNSAGHFSERILKAVIKAFSLYPLGEYVRLSSGEIGKVIEVNPDNLFRPTVRILYSRDGRPLELPKEADLALNPSLYIKEAITRDGLPRG